eukprot:TRINITY_DN2284_c0_g1_i2.p1 TRINITY_DN2284_c0_g1~~TRINITY_DN2284_c0_g1_i2.p1  ORF type:complete len:120 (+),score=32.26 TRINITY_DN2284_c0_g1_i2:46-360(+)
MVSQYTKFLDMERVTQTHSAYFNNVVDTLLVRLEELNNLIEMIKEDGITTQKEYLPVLVQKANEVNETFELIDKLSVQFTHHMIHFIVFLHLPFVSHFVHFSPG